MPHDSDRRNAPEHVGFDVGGTRCDGRLYRPDGDGPHPVVVLAHGFGGTQDARLPDYAARFSARGIAALTFDYRHFGTSGGEPRQLLDIDAQLEDLRAAVAFVRGLPEVDASRVGLWGTSFGGGHVLTIGAEDTSIRAIVAQVPFTDGLSHLGDPIQALRLGARGLVDIARGCFGGSPLLIGVVGAPGDLAAMSSPDAEAGYMRLVEDAPSFRNEVAARIVLALPRYRPTRHVERIHAAVLYQIALADSVTPARPALAAAARTRRAEVVTLPGGHFDPYVPPLFDRVVAQQAAHLHEHLVGHGGRS